MLQRMTEPLRLVVDANILVMESLRARGRQRLHSSAFELHMTERAGAEFLHEFVKRLKLVSERASLSIEEQEEIEANVLATFTKSVRVVSTADYVHLEAQARPRIPTDPDDWPSVALAILLECVIWTEDKDFFGCGLSVWCTDVLYGVVEGGGG